MMNDNASDFKEAKEIILPYLKMQLQIGLQCFKELAEKNDNILDGAIVLLSVGALLIQIEQILALETDKEVIALEINRRVRMRALVIQIVEASKETVKVKLVSTEFGRN